MVSSWEATFESVVAIIYISVMIIKRCIESGRLLGDIDPLLSVIQTYYDASI